MPKMGDRPKTEPRMYASLVGPLIGIYYPMPVGMTNLECREALNGSKLAKLWCAIYPEEAVDKMIKGSGGVKLADSYAMNLL